jgi:hypothetical protein
MRVRSKKILEYIRAKGIPLHDENAVKITKAEYMRDYKRAWKKGNQRPRKELRPCFTLKEYASLKLAASEAGYKNPTNYAKSIVLASVNSIPIIPNRDSLYEALQQVGMAVTLMQNGSDPMAAFNSMLNAEKILLEYLLKYPQ